MFKIGKSLFGAASRNGYSDAGYTRKEAMHKEGVAMLRALAKELGLQPGSYDVRSNKAGIAVTGEVTLHTDKIYVQLCQSFSSQGLTLLYRSCEGRKDYCGGTNQYQSLDGLKLDENKSAFVRKLKAIIAG